MNVWDVITKGANRFFENIASELEHVQHFATVASRWASSPSERGRCPRRYDFFAIYTNLFVLSLRFNINLIKSAKHTFHFYGGFLLSSACFFSAIFLETTPLSSRYHFITIQYFPRTFLLFCIFFTYPLAQIKKM